VKPPLGSTPLSDETGATSQRFAEAPPGRPRLLAAVMPGHRAGLCRQRQAPVPLKLQEVRCDAAAPTTAPCMNTSSKALLPMGTASSEDPFRALPMRGAAATSCSPESGCACAANCWCPGPASAKPPPKLLPSRGQSRSHRRSQSWSKGQAPAAPGARLTARRPGAAPGHRRQIYRARALVVAYARCPRSRIWS